MNWEPIETAPKDGRDILVAYDCRIGWMHIVKWFTKKSGPQWVHSYDHKRLFDVPIKWQPVPDVRCQKEGCKWCGNPEKDIDALIERLKAGAYASTNFEDANTMGEAAEALAKLGERDKYCDDAFRYYEESLDQADAEIAKLREALRVIDINAEDWAACRNEARAALGGNDEKR